MKQIFHWHIVHWVCEHIVSIYSVHPIKMRQKYFYLCILTVFSKTVKLRIIQYMIKYVLNNFFFYFLELTHRPIKHPVELYMNRSTLIQHIKLNTLQNRLFLILVTFTLKCEHTEYLRNL